MRLKLVEMGDVEGCREGSGGAGSNDVRRFGPLGPVGKRNAEGSGEEGRMPLSRWSSNTWPIIIPTTVSPLELSSPPPALACSEPNRGVGRGRDSSV